MNLADVRTELSVLTTDLDNDNTAALVAGKLD